MFASKPSVLKTLNTNWWMQNTQRVWKLKDKNLTKHDRTDNNEGESEHDYKLLHEVKFNLIVVKIWSSVLNKNYSVTILYEMRVSVVTYVVYVANKPRNL